MSLSRKDSQQIYASGGLALALAVVGMALVGWAMGNAKTADAELQQTKRRADEIRNRLRQVNIEEQEIRAKSSFYRELEDRKMVGPEQRLDWIELIDRIREQRRLFDIEYDIVAIKTDSEPNGEFQLNTSELRFQLPLLHEGDLLGFLEDLQQRAPALVQVKECDIARTPPRSDRFAAEPNLLANCRLHWTSIRREQTPGGKP